MLIIEGFLNRSITVTARFDLAHGARVALDHPLEISLDCPVCERTHRTIVIATDENQVITLPSLAKETVSVTERPAICTPTLHAFPAKVVRSALTQNGRRAMLIEVQYTFLPFVDKKNGRMARDIAPEWGRVAFNLTCPNCGKTQRIFTQTNLVGSHKRTCTCGQELIAFGEGELPQFSPVTVLASDVD